MTIKKVITIGLSGIILTSAAVAKEKGKKKTFEELDTDKDGKISEAEYIVDAKSEEKAKKRFKKKDKNGDGFLSKEEFDSKKKRKAPKKPKEEGAE